MAAPASRGRAGRVRGQRAQVTLEALEIVVLGNLAQTHAVPAACAEVGEERKGERGGRASRLSSVPRPSREIEG
jgi:hypothetical protein